MKSTLEQVAEFHAKYGHPISIDPVELNTLKAEDLGAFRAALIREEAAELTEAIRAKDKVAILDALVDLQYVLDGTFLALGYAHLKDRAFAEVHRSNMTKEPNGQDKPVKGEAFSPANLEQFL